MREDSNSLFHDTVPFVECSQLLLATPLLRQYHYPVVVQSQLGLGQQIIQSIGLITMPLGQNRAPEVIISARPKEIFYLCFLPHENNKIYTVPQNIFPV